MVRSLFAEIARIGYGLYGLAEQEIAVAVGN